MLSSFLDMDSVDQIDADRSQELCQNNANRGQKPPKWCKFRLEIVKNLTKICPILEREQIDAKKMKPTAQGATTTLLGDTPSGHHLTMSDLSPRHHPTTAIHQGPAAPWIGAFVPYLLRHKT